MNILIDNWQKLWSTIHVLIWTFLLTTDRLFETLTKNSYCDLNILNKNWQMVWNINWQIMFWSVHPYVQLTDGLIFYWLPNHVLIRTYWQKVCNFTRQHMCILTDNWQIAWNFLLTTHVLFWSSLFTTDKNCLKFELTNRVLICTSILTGNFQMTWSFYYQIMFRTERPYWQLANGLTF